MASLASISGNSPLPPHPRAAFLATREELQRRASGLDLAGLWNVLSPAERRVLLASANLEAALHRRPVEEMAPASRHAIRAAIHRMRRYAEHLNDRLHPPEAHPSVALAIRAREALATGDLRAALHFLNLIEHTR